MIEGNSAMKLWTHPVEKQLLVVWGCCAALFVFTTHEAFFLLGFVLHHLVMIFHLRFLPNKEPLSGTQAKLVNRQVSLQVLAVALFVVGIVVDVLLRRSYQ